jgi:ribosomal subunit interface protein
MDVQINGKHFDVGESLTSYVQDKLTDGVVKHFEQAVESNVTFSRQSHLVRVDCSVHAGHGIMMQSHGETDDPYASFDQALGRMEKRLRRYKRRLVDHHRNAKNNMKMMPASSYVIADDEDDIAESDDQQPIIIAETKMEIPTTTVGSAVMRMDLLGANVFVFHNSANGGLNVVFRREDGNIGWVDPENVA